MSGKDEVLLRPSNVLVMLNIFFIQMSLEVIEIIDFRFSKLIGIGISHGGKCMHVDRGRGGLHNPFKGS